jgi:hypothetical protein
MLITFPVAGPAQSFSACVFPPQSDLIVCSGILLAKTATNEGRWHPPGRCKELAVVFCICSYTALWKHFDCWRLSFLDVRLLFRTTCHTSLKLVVVSISFLSDSCFEGRSCSGRDTPPWKRETPYVKHLSYLQFGLIPPQRKLCF